MNIRHDELIKVISVYTMPEAERQMQRDMDALIAARVSQSAGAEINGFRSDCLNKPLLRDAPLTPFLVAVATAPASVVEAFLKNERTNLKTTTNAADGYKYSPIAFAIRHATLRDRLAGKNPSANDLNPETVAVLKMLMENPSVSTDLTKTSTALPDHPYTVMRRSKNPYYAPAIDLLFERNLHLATTRQDSIIKNLQNAAYAITAYSPPDATDCAYIDAARVLERGARYIVEKAFRDASLLTGKALRLAGYKDIETAQCAQKQVAHSLVARHLNEMKAMTPEERITALNATAEHLRLC